MIPRSRRLWLVLWLVLVAACAAGILRARFVSDMSAFMPKAPNARQQLLVDQLREGFIARVLMLGIEGGTPTDRARLSTLLSQAMRQSGLFLSVQNGDATSAERDQAYLFGHRYLLSPAVEAGHFTAPALRREIGAAIDLLGSDAGLVVKALFPQDPTGELWHIAGQFTGDSHPASRDGVWVSPDGSRALLLAETRAQGSDIEAQAHLLAAVRTSFDALRGPAACRLLMSGTGVFSVASRDAIEGQARRLAGLSVLLVVALLLFVYRSPRLLLYSLVPVASGAMAGIAAVSLAFGMVHGLTLGFGTTLIGEAVDYSIYFFLQRQASGHPPGFWRTMGLGALASMVGFATLLASGFPGLAQLGLYSVVGLAVALAVTFLILPALTTAMAAPPDLPSTGGFLVRTQGWLCRMRWCVPVILVLAVAVLVAHHDRIWNRQLMALSPISAADQRLDAELRRGLGTPESRYLAAFAAPDEEAALEVADRLQPRLQSLVAAGVIGGYLLPTSVLPSRDTQLRRQAALPDRSMLATSLEAALRDLPLRAARLTPFLDDVGQARTAPPLLRQDLEGTSLSFLVDALLVRRRDDVLLLVPMSAPTGAGAGPEVDVARVRAALGASELPGITVIDMLQEATDLFDTYLHEALMLTALGAVAITVLLCAALRSIPRVLRVAIPLGTAVIAVAALLVAAGQRLTILHLIGLLLTVAVGSNYALFFDHNSADRSAVSRRQTLVSMVVANATTVLSFGILGLSSVPVLAAIGTTVGLGAWLALVFSAALARPDTHA